MVTRSLLALLLLAAPLAAQGWQADSAFQRGDYRRARIEYEKVLARDSSSVVALYRLAILDSWSGRLQRSLDRFAELRRLAPNDVDIMVSQAQVLAWAGRTRESEASYDSILARSPERVDALAGRARAVAWSGDLDRAEHLWRNALAGHPDAPELLVGLGQTLYWKGEPALAEGYVAQARALTPGDKTARQLERSLRAALRPDLSLSSDGGGDSDSTAFVAVTGTYSAPLGPAVRGTIRGSWRRATRNGQTGTSSGADGRLLSAMGRGSVLRAGLGVRHLNPDVGASTFPLTAELGMAVRPARYATLNVGYTRYPFDETALLISKGFNAEAVEAGFDLAPTPRVSISGGGGVAWISDGNRRVSGVVAVLGQVFAGAQLGAFARIMEYRENLFDGYFAPDRFTVVEGRAIYSVRHERWGLRTDGGIGAQQVLRNAVHQLEWHVGFTVSRGWGANNEIALIGAATNSVAATATGGTAVDAARYRYRSLSLRFQQGL